MLYSIRQFARKTLAAGVRDNLADMLGRAALSSVPTTRIDSVNLRPRVDTNAIWSDPAISAAWDRDQEDIFSKWPSGSGAVNRGDARAIYYLVSYLKPKRVLEIGTNIGSSTIYIAAALQRYGGDVTTVDIVDVNAPDGPWSRTNAMREPPVAYMRQLGLADRVQFVKRPALEYLEAAPQYDLIFLDGSHAHNDVYREVAAAVTHLAPGGIILLHDYYPGGKPLFTGTRPLMGPYRAIARYLKEGAPLEVLPFGELPWPTKSAKDRGFSSLAFLTRAG
jgi:predicted O-methyltransferase YrrM